MKQCDECLKEFYPKSKFSRFCNQKCAALYRSRKLKEEFGGKRPWAVRIKSEVLHKAMILAAEGLSIKDAAHLVGISPTTLSVWRRKEFGFNRRTVGNRWPSPTIILPTNESDLGYIAGLLDGEGSILNTKKENRWRLIVVNTYKPVLDWLTTFAGTVFLKPQNKQFPNAKLCYAWQLTTQHDIKLLLQAIIPFMHIKKELAQEALDNINSIIESLKPKLL